MRLTYVHIVARQRHLTLSTLSVSRAEAKEGYCLFLSFPSLAGLVGSWARLKVRQEGDDVAGPRGELGKDKEVVSVCRMRR